MEAIKGCFLDTKDDFRNWDPALSYDKAGLVKLIHLVAKGGAIDTKVSLGSLLYITITEHVALTLCDDMLIK